VNYKLTGESLTQPDTRLFLQLLIPQLSGLGHKIVDKDPDILLSFGNDSELNNFHNVLLRWDKTCNKESLRFNPKAVIFSTRDNSDNLNYQNAFIIHEAVDISVKPANLNDGFVSIRKDYQSIFIASSPSWSTDDSLKTVIETYKNLKSNNPNSCLILLGDGDLRQAKRNDIFFVSNLPRQERLELFSMSNWTICHSTRVPCPYEILESLSQGTPIIHNNQPGVSEVVGAYGTTCPDDSWIRPEYPWNLQHIDIKFVAQEYSRVMQSINK